MVNRSLCVVCYAVGRFFFSFTTTGKKKKRFDRCAYRAAGVPLVRGDGWSRTTRSGSPQGQEGGGQRSAGVHLMWENGSI